MQKPSFENHFRNNIFANGIFPSGLKIFYLFTLLSLTLNLSQSFSQSLTGLWDECSLSQICCLVKGLNFHQNKIEHLVSASVHQIFPQLWDLVLRPAYHGVARKVLLKKVLTIKVLLNLIIGLEWSWLHATDIGHIEHSSGQNGYIWVKFCSIFRLLQQ